MHLCAGFICAAIRLYVSPKWCLWKEKNYISPPIIFQTIHLMLPHMVPPPPLCWKQKTGKKTKLCRIYSHISSYKSVYFSITRRVSDGQEVLLLRQLKNIAWTQRQIGLCGGPLSEHGTSVLIGSTVISGLKSRAPMATNINFAFR